MKNVTVKKEDSKTPAKKAPVKKQVKNEGKVAFMKDRNAARKKANLPAAYSEEEIKAHS